MFKIIWDREYNGVRLTMAPPAGEALNVCPRPVFWEELDFLGLDKLGWSYPRCKEPLLWACERRYYYKGELVLETKGGNVYDAPTIIVQKVLCLHPIDIHRLLKTNEDSLFLMEHEAMDFIDDTYKRYKAAAQIKDNKVDYQKLAENLQLRTKKEHVVVREECDSFDIMQSSEAERLGKNVILNSNIEVFLVSFSGGKDSQVTLDLVSRVIPESEYVVIYSDTGYELPTSLELYNNVEAFYKKQYPNLRFEIARNHQHVLFYWDELGSPSNIHRWCCGVMKTAPLYRKAKELTNLGRQPHVLSFIGTRADESSRRSAYVKIAKDAKHTNVINVSPILEWSTTEVWLYLILHNIPFNQAYRMGLGRVGCVSCPFGSDWNDHLCNHLFPDTNKPFLDKLSLFAQKSGIKDVYDYIRVGNWKIRAGGRGFETQSSLSVIQTTPDFKALITYPKEDIFQWLKTLGAYTYSVSNDIVIITLKYQKIVYRITLKIDKTKGTVLIDVPNIGDDILFVSHLRRVLNKTTYCVNCELCEVECPMGALSVVPRVNIDESKCIHCRKCLDFKDNGCITANSIKITEGLKMGNNTNTKTTINRYNNFGFRHVWLSYYMSHYDTYYDNKEHGLNVDNQLTPFTNWLRDAEILEGIRKQITPIGMELSVMYPVKPNLVWEIIWINLTYNSEICSWFATVTEYNRVYTKEELERLLEEMLPQYSSSVRKNALGSLQNTFVSSPLGDALGVGMVKKVNSKPTFIRRPHNDLTLVAAAYSLYRYAEKAGRYSLTVSEFYNPEQTDGIVRQFGIEREAFEQTLRSLEQEENHVLRAELKMGLDNIILREDLTSEDIIKLMLKNE